MESEGYSVTWTDSRKYITYTCPNGMKVRDNKLHESKFLKENMQYEFAIRQQTINSFGSFEAEAEHSSSDANGDGDISILDAIMIQKHIVNIITLEGDALAAADTDGSGDVSVLDAIRIQKYIVNIITEL